MTQRDASNPFREAGTRQGVVGLGWTFLVAAALLFMHRSLLLDASAGARSASALDRVLYDPTMIPSPLSLFVFGLLVFHRRARIRSVCCVGVGSAWGIFWLALGTATLLWSRQIDADRLVMPSLILHLVGVALLIGGRRLVYALGLPLCALVCSLPMPPEILNPLIFRLQLWTVASSSFLLDLLGRVHEVRGDLILHAGTVFQVIEGCSGFKSTLTLVLAAIGYADFVIRDPRMKGLTILSAVPIGIAMNAVRVVILVLGRIPADSEVHTAYGILAVVVGVFVLAMVEISMSRIAARMRASGSPSERSESPISAEPEARRSPTPAVLATALVATSLLTVEFLPRGSWPSVSPAVNIETLPESIEGRRAHALAVDDAWLGSVRFGHRIYRAYETAKPGAETVRVFVGHEDPSTPEISGWSPKTAIPHSGWRRIQRRPAISIAAGSGAVGVWHRWVIDYPDGHTYVQQWRTGYAPWGWDWVACWLGLDRAGVLGKTRSPLVIRIEVDDRVENEEVAWMILRQFAGRIEAWSAGSGS